MAKSVKKKANRRLKRSVRRTLGALCMMTAIIVAAIPFPDAAASNGDPVAQADEGYPYTYNVSPSSDYLVVEDTLNQSDPISSATDYYNETTNHTAYTIYQNSAGAWQMDWQFKYYAKENTTQDSTAVLDGLITKYNGQYSREEVNLSYQVYSDYIYVTQEDYTKFLSESTTEPSIKVNAYKKMGASKTNPSAEDCKLTDRTVKTLWYKYVINQEPDWYT